MLTGKRYALQQATGSPIFCRYHFEAERVTVMAFAPAGSVEPSLSDAGALRLFLSPGRARVGMLFSGRQIGSRKADEVYNLASIVTWDPKSGQYGHAETRGPQAWHLPMDYTGQLLHPYNRLAVGYSARDTSWSDGHRRRVRYAAAIMVPFENTPLQDSTVVIYYEQDVGYWANVPTENMVVEPGKPFYFSRFLPGLALAAPETIRAGERVDLTATIVSRDTGGAIAGSHADVYLEATAGYLNRQRISASPSGTFSFRALDLEPGERVKIKAGFRNYSGLAETLITVTA